jgi:hypothetical protein
VDAEAARGVSERAAESPARAEESRAYLRYLRDFAEVDGRLPSSFDGLIDSVFTQPSLVREQSARRGGGGG